MQNNLQKLYESHQESGKEGFALWEKERGNIFSRWIGKNKKVLDLGCRDGTLTKYYTSGNDVLGVDIDKRLLTKARKDLGIRTKHVNLLENWKIKEKFDVIVAGEVLEHLYYPQKIIAKCANYLKKDGLLLVSVPNAYIISSRVRFLFCREIPAHHDPTHINLFSEKKLRTMLLSHFRKVELTGIAPPAYKFMHFLSDSLFSDDLLARARK